MNLSINKYIQNLPNIVDIESSFDVFRDIYSRHKPLEWLETENLLNYSNAISRYRPDLLSVGIRLNVQVNLFIRTINRFDGDKLKLIQNDTGCFGLTEMGAGVLSGLKINTWYRETESNYILEPHINEYKNWISQGMISDWILIFAKNRDNRNISIFLCKFSDIDSNITREYKKGPTVCNYLDVAKIKITSELMLTKDSILSGTKDIPRDQILNGIYHGRWMISEAILWSIYGLIEYCEGKIEEHNKLYIFRDSLSRHKKTISNNIERIEKNRNNIHRIEVVNSFKVSCVQIALDKYVEISQQFGSHILDYPLKYDDILLNKIAEGDTDILRLSLIHNDSKLGMNSILSYNLLLGNEYIAKHYKYYSNLLINRLISKL